MQASPVQNNKIPMCASLLVEHMFEARLSHLWLSVKHLHQLQSYSTWQQKSFIPLVFGHKWRNIIEMIICIKTQICFDI